MQAVLVHVTIVLFIMMGHVILQLPIMLGHVALSRNAEEDVIICRLLFGDGSARGVAAMIIWILLLGNPDSLPTGDAAVEDLVLSLLQIPTNFEEHGDGSERAKLIAQAARQNQLAQVLPVNTLEWLSMTVQFTGIDVGTLKPTKEARQLLTNALDSMVGAYNELPDVNAYSVEPASKRSRTRKGATPKHTEQDEGFDKGLKIGVRRLTAMKNFLQGGTFTGLSKLREHLLWVSDYKYSVITDEILMKKWLWVGSHLPKEFLPPDALIQRTDAGATAGPQSKAHEVLNHDSPLSASQFDMMIEKAISIYEDETGHIDRDELKVKSRPSEDGGDVAFISRNSQPLTLSPLSLALYARAQCTGHATRAPRRRG